MNYSIELTPHLDKKLDRLGRKNPKQVETISKKLEEIARDPNRFKNLRGPMKHLKRVHIDKHFVLLFSVDESSKTVVLVDFDHHDSVYK